MMKLAFYKWQRRILRQDKSALSISALERLQLLEKQALSDLDQEFKAIQFHDANFYHTHKVGGALPQNDYEQLGAIASFDGAIAMATTQGMVAQGRGQNEAALRYFWENVEVWFRFPRQMQDHPRRFIAALTNYLQACHLLNNFEGYAKVMDRIRDIPIQNEVIKSEIEFKCLKLLFVLYLNNFDLDAAATIVEQLLHDAPAKGQANALDQETHYNIAIFYFVSSKSRLALRHFGELIGHRRSLSSPERRDAALLFEVLIFLDLEEEELAASRLRSLLRIQGKLALQPWALPLMRLLATAIKATAGKPRQKWYAEMASKMKGYDGIKGLGFEEVELWLRAKLSRMSLAEVIQEKYRNRLDYRA